MITKATEKYQLYPNPSFDQCLEQKERLARLIKNLQITKHKTLDRNKLQNIDSVLSQLISLGNRVREICRGSSNKSTPRNRQKGGHIDEEKHRRLMSRITLVGDDDDDDDEEEEGEKEPSLEQYMDRLKELTSDFMTEDEKEEFNDILSILLRDSILTFVQVMKLKARYFCI